jgi:predicted metal-binding membrane protein
MAHILVTVLRRDRLVVLAGLGGVTVLAWLYLILLAAGMVDGPGAMGEAMANARPIPWTAGDFALMVMMWSVMMVGMMLPGATPMILLFAMINRKKREAGYPFVPTGAFALGYAGAWTAFSLFATILQWALHSAALLSPMLVSTSAVLAGALFIAAGAYQLTPLKHACLKNCRSPVHFIMTRWRSGAGGALRMGLEHGAYCVGCCWFLMGLLFVLGVMNLLWVAALTILVLVEKAAPHGEWTARISGVAMLAAGLYLLILA